MPGNVIFVFSDTIQAIPKGPDPFKESLVCEQQSQEREMSECTKAKGLVQGQDYTSRISCNTLVKTLKLFPVICVCYQSIKLSRVDYQCKKDDRRLL